MPPGTSAGAMMSKKTMKCSESETLDFNIYLITFLSSIISGDHPSTSIPVSIEIQFYDPRVDNNCPITERRQKDGQD
jgi:hypothetical protein